MENIFIIFIYVFIIVYTHFLAHNYSIEKKDLKIINTTALLRKKHQYDTF